MANLFQLEPYHRAFLPHVLRWRSEAVSVRYNPLLQLGAEDLHQVLAAQGADFDRLESAPSHRWFLLQRGTVVGTVSLQNISPQGYAEIGYMIGEEFYGRGYATAGVGQFLGEIFARTPLRRVMALVHEENAASCRVLEKLGFSREGLLREHFFINGAPVNEVCFGLLKREWRGAGTAPRP